MNKNGIQEAGEPRKNGVTVLLKNAGGIVLQTTVTQRMQEQQDTTNLQI
ncbi:MAG: hypothetical protein IPJ43_19325 [Saprospiraceae bacterium]|nr:hypothetical protein [Saprospiraceae bacterium]